MTAKTESEALALEAARGAEHIAMIRAEGFRAGAEAMREAAARVAASKFYAGPNRALARPDELALDDAGASIARHIRSLPIPEIDRCE